MKKLSIRKPVRVAGRQQAPVQKSDQLLEWVVTFFMAMLIVIIFVKIVFL